MTNPECLHCPLCGASPYIVLNSGHQAFCPSDECEVILWDAMATLEENLMDADSIRYEVRNPSAIGNPDETPEVWVAPPFPTDE